MKFIIRALAILWLGVAFAWANETGLDENGPCDAAPAPRELQTQDARPIVIERFTGTWCPYCYAASKALDRIEDYSSRRYLIVVSYQISDSYSSSFGPGRASFMGVSGYPTVIFNGVRRITGGYAISEGEAGIANLKANYEANIQAEQSRMGTNMPFNCELFGEMGVSNLRWKLRVTSQTGYPNTVGVFMLVTESGIRVNASNGQTVLNSVCRASTGVQTFTMTAPGTEEITGYFFGSIPRVSAANLYPVAILFDTTTKEIIGATALFTAPPATAAEGQIWPLYE